MDIPGVVRRFERVGDLLRDRQGLARGIPVPDSRCALSAVEGFPAPDLIVSDRSSPSTNFITM